MECTTILITITCTRLHNYACIFRTTNKSIYNPLITSEKKIPQITD